MQNLPETQAAQNYPADIPQFHKIHVVVNPVSGLDNGVSPIESIRKLLTDAGIAFEVSVTEKSGDAERFAREAAANGADIVGVYGGDGTVMEVAKGLMNTEMPMAIFPGGTANVMSVELGISQDLNEAIALIMGDKRSIRAVDMGEVNETHFFFLRSGIGLEAELTVGVDREEKRRLGRIAYFRQAWRSLWHQRPVRYSIQLDGKRRIRRRGVSCIVCNSANIGLPNVQLAPNISVSDGWLDIIVIRGTDVRSLFNVLWSTVKSVLPFWKNRQVLDHWKAREVVIKASRRQTVGVDGESIEVTFPVRVKVHPAAVRVVVPRLPDANSFTGV